MLMGEPISAGLRRTDKSVLNHRGVKIDTNDDTARVYPSRISEDGSGEVERRENAIAQKKSVSNACSIVVFPTMSSLGLFAPANVDIAPGKSIVVNVPWDSRYP
jgi:hypothetical protein